MVGGSCKLIADAVIFDLDGTLIDSAPIYYKIIDVVFAGLGLPPVSKKILLEAMKDGEFDWDLVLPANMIDHKEGLIKKARRIIDDIAPSMFRKQIKLIPGTGEVLEALVTEGLILGLVTSTPMEYMAVKLVPLQKAGLDGLLKIIITSDDVENKKPHAEPLVKCSQKLGVAADKCVYIGDTRVDIKAGNAAGMKTIGVLSGFDDYDALSQENPDVIIGSIAELFKAVTITPGSKDERHAARSAEKFN